MKLVIAIILVFLAGCTVARTVHQDDLDAWVGVPVIALDTHSIMLTLPMIKTVTDSGVEIRVYSNKRGISSCGGTGFGAINSQQSGTMSYQNFTAFRNCTSGLVGCDNIFYVRDGKVMEAKAVGHCYTDERSRPEKGYEKFMK